MSDATMIPCGKSAGILSQFGTFTSSAHRLRLAGNCDVVEFRAAPDGVALQGYEGLWQPQPVEYKRGAPKAQRCRPFAALCSGDGVGGNACL